VVADIMAGYYIFTFNKNRIVFTNSLLSVLKDTNNFYINFHFTPLNQQSFSKTKNFVGHYNQYNTTCISHIIIIMHDLVSSHSLNWRKMENKNVLIIMHSISLFCTRNANDYAQKTHMRAIF